ncbi:hypothetical protein ACFL6X_05690 [Candidatus Latescibacterota bacterium]
MAHCRVLRVPDAETVLPGSSGWRAAVCLLSLLLCAAASPAQGQVRHVWLEGPETSGGDLVYSLLLDDASGIFAIEVDLLFPERPPDQAEVRLTPMLQDFQVASNLLDGQVLIAMASAQAGSGSGAFAEVAVPDPGEPPEVGLARVSLNGGRIPVDYERIAPIPAAQNTPPAARLVQVEIRAPDEAVISYVLHDQEEDPGVLSYALYLYPDAGLTTALDISTFGTLVVDHRDATHELGKGEFVEGQTDEEVSVYTWGDPGVATMNTLGYAPLSRIAPGYYYLYLVADDGHNDPVVDILESPVRLGRVPTAVTGATWGQAKSSGR